MLTQREERESLNILQNVCAYFNSKCFVLISETDYFYKKMGISIFFIKHLPKAITET